MCAAGSVKQRLSFKGVEGLEAGTSAMFIEPSSLFAFILNKHRIDVVDKQRLSVTVQHAHAHDVRSCILRVSCLCCADVG